MSSVSSDVVDRIVHVRENDFDVGHRLTRPYADVRGIIQGLVNRIICLRGEDHKDLWLRSYECVIRMIVCRIKRFWGFMYPVKDQRFVKTGSHRDWNWDHPFTYTRVLQAFMGVDTPATGSSLLAFSRKSRFFAYSSCILAEDIRKKDDDEETGGIAPLRRRQGVVHIVDMVSFWVWNMSLESCISEGKDPVDKRGVRRRGWGDCNA